MNTLTNLAAVASSLIVTSYSTNLVNTDNAVRKSWQEPTFTLMLPIEANQRTVTYIITPATERYEQITIKEHKTAEVTLTNGVVLRQELTNRVVSDRIRTFKIITTEEFVDEKDAPETTSFLYLHGSPIPLTNSVEGSFLKVTNSVLWQIDNTGTNITDKVYTNMNLMKRDKTVVYIDTNDFIIIATNNVPGDNAGEEKP